MAKGVFLVVVLWLLVPSAGGASQHQCPWAPDARWQCLRLAETTQAIPIRLVAQNEPWRQVVQDVQARFQRTLADAQLRVGFYGHGAFVTPEEVVAQHRRFVAALGLHAALDVMIFPQWHFPQHHPFQELPRAILQELWDTPPQHLGDTIKGVLQHPLRQFEQENRAATAHAALRLAHGIQAFHAAQMTPALAAFSNSAMVIVRLGELLEQGKLSVGEHALVLPDQVRQEIVIRDIVMFGYPLPNGVIAPALRQQVQGRIVNVIPAQCWKQVGGNFPVNGSAENIAVGWAPTHAHWPQLSPQSEGMAILGAFLGGRSEAGRLAVQLTPRPRGLGQWVEAWQAAVCDLLPDFQQFLRQ